MKIPLFLDTETYSPVNLKMQGTYRYAEECEIIMWQYAIGDGEVIIDDYLTHELSALLVDDRYEIVIHNSNFDRTVIRHCTGIDIPTSNIFDTMACAMAHSLPGALGTLCEILEIDQGKSKDKDGKKLINFFCKPQKKRGSEDVYRNAKETHPEEWERFREYGRLDIEAMREVYKVLPRWNFKGFERELWELDQKINDKGVRVDLELAHAAIRATTEAKKGHDANAHEMTDGAIKSTNQRQALIDYIKDAYGIEIKDLTAATVKKLIACELPQPVVDLLLIRLDSSKTSTSKYKRVINGVCKDGRLRGLLQFCGAGRTARWAGRLFQPQNLPRPTIKGERLNEEIEYIKNNSYGLLSSASPMEVCSSALRGVIVAPRGKKLVVADLSNIEGRKLAWLAGESWKVKAFRDFDAGRGHDLYNLTYAKAFGVPIAAVEADEGDMRQIGKVMELAFGYGGGVGAWLVFAMGYGIDLEDMAKKAIDRIPPDILREARKFLEWFKEQGKKTYGLSDTAFIVCDSFKRMWRNEHPNVAAYWKALETTCAKAINNPGTKYVTHMHKIRLDGAWLRVTLPSGRCLNYPQPKVVDGKMSYAGTNQFTRKWGRINTYGGKLSENIDQGSSRDVFAYGMVQADKKGFELVLTVHDEIIAENDDTGEFTVEGLSEVMSTPPIWAIDLPLAAKGAEMYRYAK